MNQKGITGIETLIVLGILLTLFFLVFSIFRSANDPDFEKNYCMANKFTSVQDLPATCLKYYNE